MLPQPRHYERVKRQIEVALGQSPPNPDAAIEVLLTAAADLLGIVGSCWHHTDPSSGLPIASATLGEPAGSLEWSLTYEFEHPDFSRFDDLRRRRAPVAAISIETRGELQASARFREMISPTGSADELRVAFVDSFGFWAALVIFTNRTMTTDDLRFISELLPRATRALRAAAAAKARESRTPSVEDDDGLSVLILNRDDHILAADATARKRLALLPEPRRVAVPGVISFLAAQARWSGDKRASTARMRTNDGRWFLVNASMLDDPRGGEVAVVIQPAPATSVLDQTLRAAGLSGREREVTALALRGQSAKMIASTLAISPWTVQDHLKAIYEKTGLRTRAELLTILPAAADPAG